MIEAQHFAERFVKTAKSECTDRMIWFGDSALRRGLRALEVHYLAERNHQSLDNKIIDPASEVGELEGEVQARPRLGGLLNYYHRTAA